MKIEVSPLFEKNLKYAKKKDYFIVVNQGGSRSGKTYNLLLLLVIKYLLREKGLIIDIARKTQAEMKTTVLVDWIEILGLCGILEKVAWNKTANEFRFNGNLVRFIGLDKAQKKRGAKRDILFINEANGVTLEDWIQLSMRTTKKIFIDFNPSERFWLHENILPVKYGGETEREDVAFIKSTYKDNPFLEPQVVKTIENLIDIDDYYYKVYALGELAELKGLIYDRYATISIEEYENLPYEEICYGVDWGTNHPMTLIECKICDGKPYYHELYYEKEKIPSDLIEYMNAIEISHNDMIYPDVARKDAVKQLKMAGYSVGKTNKSVQDGIAAVKFHGLTITETSKNLLEERKKYKYKQLADGSFIDEPVKLWDDGLDSVRYIALSNISLKFLRG